MDRLDELQALAFESDYACAVLGSRETGQFLLVELDKDCLLSDAENLKARLGGLYFCGLAGYRRGECVFKSEPDLDCVSMMASASYEFARRVAEWLKSKRTDDGGDFLERLWSLPDNRN